MLMEARRAHPGRDRGGRREAAARASGRKRSEFQEVAGQFSCILIRAPVCASWRRRRWQQDGGGKTGERDGRRFFGRPGGRATTGLASGGGRRAKFAPAADPIGPQASWPAAGEAARDHNTFKELAHNRPPLIMAGGHVDLAAELLGQGGPGRAGRLMIATQSARRPPFYCAPHLT